MNSPLENRRDFLKSSSTAAALTFAAPALLMRDRAFAANTDTTAGNYEPIGEETVGMLTLLADKVAAFLDNRTDQRLCPHQERFDDTDHRAVDR